MEAIDVKNKELLQLKTCTGKSVQVGSGCPGESGVPEWGEGGRHPRAGDLGVWCPSVIRGKQRGVVQASGLVVAAVGPTALCLLSSIPRASHAQTPPSPCPLPDSFAGLKALNVVKERLARLEAEGASLRRALGDLERDAGAAERGIATTRAQAASTGRLCRQLAGSSQGGCVARRRRACVRCMADALPCSVHRLLVGPPPQLSHGHRAHGQILPTSFRGGHTPDSHQVLTPARTAGPLRPPLPSPNSPAPQSRVPGRERPLTLEYMRLKAEVDELQHQVQEWRRKADVARGSGAATVASAR